MCPRWGTLVKKLRRALDESAFYEPFAAIPDTIAPADRARVLKAASQAITNRVVPALQRLHTFISNEYLPACPISPSLSQWSNGAPVYHALVRRWTTTTMEPQEIHELGLHEVNRIQHEMTATLGKIGYQGTLREFRESVRTEERFYYKTQDELLTAYRATAKRIEPLIVRFFRTFPRMPFGVEPMRSEYGGGVAAGYAPPPPDGSRAGIVRVAVAKPDIHPKFEIMALMLHEGVPGHHLQMALERELNPGTSAAGWPVELFLRTNPAFTEGWGLYAESLGNEMGLYADPYNKFGQLSMDMLRAVRLVVDTGIHWAGWSPEQAKQYIMDQTGKSDLVAETEFSRAIWDPGSLLAYKVGEQQIKAMRARVSSRLGPEFDVREFHEFLLRSGPLPFDLMERKLEMWLDERSASEQ